MRFMRGSLLSSIFLFIIVSCIIAAPDPDFHTYLLFGQSNMAGGCNGWTATPESIDNLPSDCDTTSRVKLLAFTNCSDQESNPCSSFTLNRRHNQWYTAFPPYHNCNEGIGPADYFGKTLLDSIHEDIRIGFIPCALSGQSINMFKKGVMSEVPDWCNSYLAQLGSTSVYEWMKERCLIAQESGVIKAILFHQGESDASSPENWVSDVKSVFDNLKTDLNLDDSIPVVVGELLYEEAGGVAASMNPRVNQLASEYPSCKVASAEGLEMRPGDSHEVHFDCESVRELGYRYANAFLSLADNEWVQRKGSVNTIERSSGSHSGAHKVMLGNSRGLITVYTLTGRAVSRVPAGDINRVLHTLPSITHTPLKWSFYSLRQTEEWKDLFCSLFQ